MTLLRSLLKKLFRFPAEADFRSHQTILAIGLVGCMLHAIFVFLFAWLGIMPMAWFNILSVGLWGYGSILARGGKGVNAMLIAYMELGVHQALAVHYIGWAGGFQQYLIPTILGFVMPGRWRLFAIITTCSIAEYVTLYFYDSLHVIYLSDSTHALLGLLYTANSIAALVMGTAGAAYYMTSLARAEAALEVAHNKSEALLRNILPEEIAASLKDRNQTIADLFEEASVLFADIVNFTPMSAGMRPVEVVNLLNEVFSGFDALVEQYNLEKIKTIGDCYMVAAGVPRPNADHAYVLTQLALDMQSYVAQHEFRGHVLSFRIGLNSGPLVAGVIGRKKFIYDLWGDAVNTASRMESHGKANRIQITRSTYELVRDRFVCEPQGTIDVKGKGQMEIWHVLGARP